MPKILTAIAPQAFELIRDQLAAILADEIDYQGVLTYDPDLLRMNVFVESNNPNDKEDLPLINVSLATGSWPDRKGYDGNIKGNYIYNIDVYSSSPASINEDGTYLPGDNLSAIKLQKIMGKCRAILENPIYKTLAYKPGFIERVGLQELNIRAEGKGNDALNTSMGRLTYLVEVQEKVTLLHGSPLLEWTTVTKINNTDDGYLFIGTNII